MLVLVLVLFVIVIYLATKQQRALGARPKVFARSRSNWNLGMLVFVEGGKLEYPKRTLVLLVKTRLSVETPDM